MRPVVQTRLHSPGKPGNCFAACLASLLECDINDVPWPNQANVDSDDWGSYWRRIAVWLAERGLFMIEWDVDVKGPKPWVSDAAADAEAYWLAAGPSPRGVRHSVVMKGAEIVHDPHPEGGGISAVEIATVIAALDPLEGCKNSMVKSRHG